MRGGYDTQMRHILGVWLVGLELKIPPEHKNANIFAFSCPGGPNTPNVMLCHKGRARHTDTSHFGCLAGGGGELELEIPLKHKNTIYSRFHIQVVQVVQFKGREGRG